MLFFRVKPADGLEPYLGAWGHMLAASDDLIDLIHTHPFLADRRPSDSVQRDLPARADLPDLGSVSAQGRGQYGGIYRAGLGVEVAMRRTVGTILAKILAMLLARRGLPAHDVITTPITFSREISRLLYSRCASCHRQGGSAFSLLTYPEARPWAQRSKRRFWSAACRPGAR